MAAATTRLYLADPHAYEADATVVAMAAAALAFDRTCFYPGGGGQPPDRGTVTLPSGETLTIDSAHADGDGGGWHPAAPPPPPGRRRSAGTARAGALPPGLARAEHHGTARLRRVDHRRADRRGLLADRL